MAKQYGLIKPEKGKVLIRPSIFNESSDSDSESKPTGLQGLKKKERTAQNKVLEEDPTVYQYDEVYDEIQSQRKEAKLARKDLDKKPKYINKLLEAADRRKRENERRIERQVQKERELEGDMYKDKESFVTSSYKQKLEEMKALEEKEKREEYLETIGDVKKQGDLSGFYRHLYAQQVNYDEEEAKEQSRKQKDDTNINEDDPNIKEEDDESVKKKEKSVNKKRKYRKRESSKSSDEAEAEVDTKHEHLPSNLDADSDFSIDSDSETETNESGSKKAKVEETQEVSEEKLVEVKQEVVDEDKDEENKENGNGNADESIEKKEKEEKKKKKREKKPKVDIWKKRTVGDIFDEAVQRFYERKAERQGLF